MPLVRMALPVPPSRLTPAPDVVRDRVARARPGARRSMLFEAPTVIRTPSISLCETTLPVRSVPMKLPWTRLLVDPGAGDPDAAVVARDHVARARRPCRRRCCAGRCRARRRRRRCPGRSRRRRGADEVALRPRCRSRRRPTMSTPLLLPEIVLRAAVVGAADDVVRGVVDVDAVEGVAEVAAAAGVQADDVARRSCCPTPPRRRAGCRGCGCWRSCCRRRPVGVADRSCPATVIETPFWFGQEERSGR